MSRAARVFFSAARNVAGQSGTDIRRARAAVRSLPWPSRQRMIFWLPILWLTLDKSTVAFGLHGEPHDYVSWAGLVGTIGIIVAVEMRLSARRRQWRERSSRPVLISDPVAPADVALMILQHRVTVQDQQISQLVATMQRMCEAAGMRPDPRPLRLVRDNRNDAA